MRNLLILFFLTISIQSYAQQNTAQLKAEFTDAIINKDYDLLVSSAKKLGLKKTGNHTRYYHDVLKFLPDNAILITNNIEDTYALLAIQLYSKYKTSINVVSIGLMNSSLKYATTQLNTLKINSSFDKTSPSIYLSRILKETKTKTFISLTVNPDSYSKFKKDLFIVGLSLEYKATSNYSSLVNFDSSLKEVFFTVQHLTIEKELYANYLPPLLTLYKLKLKKWGEAKKTKHRILMLSKYLGVEKKVEKILESYEK